MNQYLLTLVLKSSLEDKERKDVIESIKKKLDGGKVTKEDSWDKRDLAYPINKQTEGFYIHMEFEAEPKVISGLDKSLKVEEDILRYLLVRA